MSRARVVGLGVEAVRVDPDDLLELARRNLEPVVPAQRAGVEIPEYWGDAEERWTTEAAAYQAGNVGVHLTLFATLEENGEIERFDFGGVGSAWVRTEHQVQAAARDAADAYRPMFWDDLLEDDAIEDISQGAFDALPLAVSLEAAMRTELSGRLPARQAPARPEG